MTTALVPDVAASAVLASVLPAAVMVAAVRTDVSGPLAPVERAAVNGAVPGRVREFVTARGCARAALSRLQPARATTPLPATDAGGVHWPDGVVGSITHCAGFRGAAVADAATVRALGIDAEPAKDMPAPLVADVVDEDERALLARTLADLPWTRIAFCAKEALYKAWHPLIGAWLGFDDATVRAVGHRRTRGNVSTGTLTLELRRRAPAFPTTVDVRFAMVDGLLIAGLALPAR